MDGSQFDKKSYARVVKQTRHIASEIANKLKLPLLQPGYNERNEEIEDVEPTWVDLLQSYNLGAVDKSNIASSSTAPTSTTLVVAPPGRAAVEDEDNEFFLSLHHVTCRGDAEPQPEEAEAAKEIPAATPAEEPQPATEAGLATANPENPAPEAGA